MRDHPSNDSTTFPLDFRSLPVLSKLETGRQIKRAASTRPSGGRLSRKAVSMIPMESGGTTELPFVIKSGDRFLWGFPLLALCCEIILATLRYFDRIGDTLGFAIYLSIPVTAVMLGVAVIGISALRSGRFKRAASFLLAPSILLLPLIFPVAPLEYRALDLLRFYLTKGYYDRVVDALSPTQRVSSVLFFKWGMTDLLEAPSYHWLVYDQSGEITLPAEERSREWKRRIPSEPRRLGDEHCPTSSYHLSGHYYSVAMHCTDVD